MSQPIVADRPVVAQAQAAHNRVFNVVGKPFRWERIVIDIIRAQAQTGPNPAHQHLSKKLNVAANTV